MRLFIDRTLAIFWVRAINIDARQFVLAIVPRRDLAPAGYQAYCALELRVTWPALDRYRGRWWPHIELRSDAREMSMLIAKQAGALDA